VTVCLEDEIDIGRGDMLVHSSHQPHTHRAHRRLHGVDARAGIAAGPPYLLKHTTTS
jgi:sulfate adenylyltransferase subunit 1 (EFTu-like GTPase family)